MAQDFDPSEKDDVERRNNELKVRKEGVYNSIRVLMDSKYGRIWMKELLERCHVFGSTFDTNALKMAFGEGERNIGLMIMADVTGAAPAQYQLMLEEQEKDNDPTSTP